MKVGEGSRNFYPGKEEMHDRATNTEVMRANVKWGGLFQEG